MRTLRVVRTDDDRDIPGPGVHTVDPAHTSAEFVGRHLMKQPVPRPASSLPERHNGHAVDQRPQRRRHRQLQA